MSFKPNRGQVSFLRYAVQAALCLGLASPLVAQQSGPVLKTSKADAPAATSSPSAAGNSITAPVVVHDKHGAVIQTLTKDQLQLWVDKKPAEIRTFAADTNAPLTLGLLIDVGPTQREVLAEERKASQAFLDSMLTAADSGFIIQFARQADLLQDVTASKSKLADGIQQIGTASPGGDNAHDDSSDQASNNGGNNGGTGNGPNGGGNGGGPIGGASGPWGRGGGGRSGNVPTVGAIRRPNTVLYDTLFLSAGEVIARQTGRKVLIVLSDGTDHGSKEPLGSAIEAAQRADAIVYAIYVKGQQPKPDHSDRGFSVGDPNQCDPYGPPGGYPGSYPPYGYPGGYPGDCTPHPQTGSVESSDSRKMLERIADQTGGRLFEADKKTPLADIYKQIADELHAQYRLTFAPDKDASTDGYHRIDLSLKGDPKDLFVQTRDGYYAGPPD